MSNIVAEASHPEIDATVATPEPVEVTTADLLVEEVSIDGMCGVY